MKTAATLLAVLLPITLSLANDFPGLPANYEAPDVYDCDMFDARHEIPLGI